MKAFTRLEHRELASIAEKGLRGLGFTFLKNGGGNVIEFEVQSPCRCIVSVQNLTRVAPFLPFIPRKKVESMIEIRRLIGGGEREDALSKVAESIVGALSPDVPRSEWEDLDEFVRPENTRAP